MRETDEAIATYARVVAAADAQPEIYRRIPDDILLALTGWAEGLQQRHQVRLAGDAARKRADADVGRRFARVSHVAHDTAGGTGLQVRYLGIDRDVGLAVVGVRGDEATYAHNLKSASNCRPMLLEVFRAAY